MADTPKRFTVTSNYSTKTYEARSAADAEQQHRDEIATDAPEVIKDVEIESVTEAQGGE